MRFEVGQEIWIGDFHPLAPTHVTCPDCGGTGRLRVTFHDETQVSIDCSNCAPGLDAPTGKITIYQQEIRARQASICGFENAHGKTRWHVDGTDCSYRIIEDEDAFASEAEAIAWAAQRQGRYEEDQRKKIFSKEKDTKTWAWNASYHRNRIKAAQKEIEYHTAKLTAAAIKAAVTDDTCATEASA